MREERNYISFPLFLFRNLFDNKVDTINKILCYGACYRAMEAPVKESDVINRLIADTYREIKAEDKGETIDLLSEELRDLVYDLSNDERYVIIAKDFDRYGFDYNGVFNPVHEREEYMLAFRMNRELQKLASIHYRNCLIKKFLRNENINAVGIDKIKSIAEKVKEEIPDGEVLCSAEVKKLFEFRDKDKSEKELIEFAAYTAITSTIDRRKPKHKRYVKTNKKMITARMIGYRSSKGLDMLIDNIPPKARLIYNRYLKSERLFRKLKVEQMQQHWGLNFQSKSNGFWVAKDCDLSRQELCEVAESKNKSENRRTQKAINDAMEKLAKEKVRKAAWEKAFKKSMF